VEDDPGGRADLGIDPIWFLVLMAINLTIAFISPPVGFSRFYPQTVAPEEVRTIDIHRGALPFMGCSWWRWCWSCCSHGR